MKAVILVSLFAAVLQGQVIRTIPYVAFGDADSKGLYITSCAHLFRLRLKSSGLR